MERQSARSCNIVLIGMPAAGKTTVGRLLARRLGRSFIDTDTALEERHGARLAELLQAQGLAGFLALEEQVLLEVRARAAVIATGGSAVYSDRGMAALRRGGVVVFLDCPLDVLAARVGDPAARGTVMASGQTLAELHRERLPLYRRHADVVVACAGDLAATASAVLAAVNAAASACRH